MKATCEYCGKDLGYEKKFMDGPDTCGDPECNRFLRQCFQGELADRRYRAEQDDYERYGR
jgi:hypothetical protein